jgi:hypothetical protein
VSFTYRPLTWSPTPLGRSLAALSRETGAQDANSGVAAHSVAIAQGLRSRSTSPPHRSVRQRRGPLPAIGPRPANATKLTPEYSYRTSGRCTIADSAYAGHPRRAVRSGRTRLRCRYHAGTRRSSAPPTRPARRSSEIQRAMAPSRVSNPRAYSLSCRLGRLRRASPLPVRSMLHCARKRPSNRSLYVLTGVCENSSSL